jgi:hypothetical protein
MVISSSGRWVLAVDREDGTLYSFERVGDAITAREDRPTETASIRRLIAALAGSDDVLVRDDAGRLLRHSPGTQTAVDIVDGSHMVVAIGATWVATQRFAGTDDVEVAIVDAGSRSPEPVVLLRASRVSRAAFSAEDRHFVVTVADEEGLHTLVFALPDGGLIDRFPGSLVSAREDAGAVLGLHPVASHAPWAVYRTEEGALALRDLDRAGACLLRSATAGDHVLGGFAADGTIYAQSLEDTPRGPRLRTLALTPESGDAVTLGDREGSARMGLAAVPGRRARGVLPWAVASSELGFFGLATDGVATPLGLLDAAPLAGRQEGLWFLEARPSDDGDDDRTLRLLRVTPETSPSGEMAPLRAVSAPAIRDLDDPGATPATFAPRLSGTQLFCVADLNTSRWGYGCGAVDDLTFLRQRTPPSSEDPSPPHQPDPELPDPTPSP